MKYLNHFFKIYFIFNVFIHNIEASDNVYEAAQPSPLFSQSKRSVLSKGSSSSQDTSSTKKAKTEKSEGKEADQSSPPPQMKECGIWRQNLDYQYNNTVFSTHEWHLQSANTISVKRENRSPNSNFAKVRLEAVFHNSNSQQTTLKTFEPPVIFSNGGASDDRDCISLSELSVVYTEEGNAFSFIKQLLGEDVQIDKDFQDKYHHPETTILFSILNAAQTWMQDIKSDDKASELHYIVLSICTYYDPCEVCSKILYRAGKQDGFFAKEMKEALGTRQKDIKVNPNMRIFINVSSLCQNQDSHPLPPLYSDIIRLPSLKMRPYFPFFAHMRQNVRPDHKAPTWGSIKSVPAYALEQSPSPTLDQD